ncbi:MAG: Lrp/AsnC family transcriptional regulator [Rhodospirillales bacterium]|jgi:DNA-binding Lrp family transcriptional regulator|nr:Lrp/AsnC family transcriptional regulator [Rhodospirillales bacterium]MDP6883136.1 Lrp/AsnC family transcriptional regulator [Rhodospirillales bacterium]
MDDLDRQLLDHYQRGFPLSPSPYADVAEHLGVGEGDVIGALERLRREGAIARLGAVVRPGAMGAGTLAAMTVPDERIEEVAALVNGYDEVNHNYEREHRLNLWFVVIAADRARLDAVLADIEQRTGLKVIDLPMEQEYHLDLGFALEWT